MKHSISRRFALIFILLMIGTILLCWFINGFFLEKFYKYNKIQTLHSSYDLLQTDYANGSLEDETASAEIVRFSELNNISMYIRDYATNVYYSTTREAGTMEFRLNTYLILQTMREAKEIESGAEGAQENDSDLEETLIEEITEESGEGSSGMGFLKEVLGPFEENSAIYSCDDYEIFLASDNRTETEYLEMWGCLDEENQIYFLIRTPMESIRETATLANRFFLFVGLIATIISAIIMLIVTRRMTRPILNLTEISRRMAELDFTAKYEPGKTDDEINRLGLHMNTMSDNLENAISELKTANNELQQDIEKKEQIDEMRKEFLSNVSHELKTPIALIQGYAEGLQEGINDDEESRNYYCEVIMDEAGKMNEMVKKLLNLNQLEFGNDMVQMERFDLAAMASNFLQSAEILIKQKDVTLKYEDYEPTYVWGDEFMIEEVMRNYFSNALNHVDNERIIEVKILRGGGKVRLSVFNTGTPIPESSINQIWDKFYKVDKARTRDYGGSGVGLSIVKAIMNRMNQNYGVINYDNGVEFWFELDSDGPTEETNA